MELPKLFTTHISCTLLIIIFRGDIMFAVLQTVDLKSVFIRSKIQSQRITLPSGEAFFIVDISCRKGKVPWKKLERCLGILKKDVLLPDSIKIPDDIDITAFKPDIFPRLLLINSAVDYIMKDRKSESLCIFDESGIYARYIERLVNRFNSISVITPYPENYDAVSKKLMEDYGFSLIVSSKGKCSDGTVISHCCEVPLYFRGRIYTNEIKYLMNARVVTGQDIELPEEYEKLRPGNIGRLQFAAALYEKCRIEELGELRYSNFGS